MNRSLALFALLGITAASLLCAPAVRAQVSAAPALLNYQGRLATPSGNPIPDGAYEIRFSLWDAATAGTEKWNQTISNVQVKNGVFAVLLNTNTAGLFNGNLWLETKIGTDAALTPRQQLVSVAYAMKANSVVDGSITSASIANGAITAEKLASGAVGGLAWLLGGNAGTNPATQFLGTLDNQPLVFRTNNAERMRLLSGGNVGINAPSPGSRLQINPNLHAGNGYGLLVANANLGVNIQYSNPNATFGYGLIVDKSDAADGSTPFLVRANAAVSAANVFSINDSGYTQIDGAGYGLVVNKTGTASNRTRVAYNSGLDMGFVQIVNSANAVVAGMGGGGSNGGALFAANASGTQTVFLNNAGDSYFNGGNVGIGTATPNGKLHVVGGSAWTTAGWTKSLNLSAASALELGWAGSGTTARFGLGSTAGNLYLFTTPSEAAADAATYRLFMDGSSGNIGIGTIAPTAKLDVSGSLAATSATIPSLSGNVAISGGVTATGATINGNASVTGSLNAASAAISGNAAINGSVTAASATIPTLNGGVSLTGGSSWTAASWTKSLALNPASALEFGLGASGTTPRFGLGSSAGDFFLFSSTADSAANTADYRVFVDGATGNVGIGNINPTSKLDVTGEITAQVVTVTGGSDVAEPYHVASSDGVKPIAGMLVTIDPDKIGQMRVANRAYDSTVAGIISGANGIRPGITLTQKGTVADGELPVASIGRVWCWCDANANGSIKAGDLLTSSDTPGHAMKATDREKRDGAVIGKAMSSLKSGKGLVLVLVSLK